MRGDAPGGDPEPAAVPVSRLGAAAARVREVHVWPKNGEHARDLCWCQPTVQNDINGRLFVHRRSLDAPAIEPPDWDDIEWEVVS